MRPLTQTRKTALASVAMAVTLGLGLARDAARASDPATSKPTGAAKPTCKPPIPAHTEGNPIPSPSGSGFCYVGGHPVDRRKTAGPAWHDAKGAHDLPYPPIDLRLFNLDAGCYHFVGDPTDFGYEGRTWSYYGAHPLPTSVGGGHCYMGGGHQHLWEPWSDKFVAVGPYRTWEGGFDAEFWTYWPYYAHFHKTHYPRFYAGGKWMRERGGPTAPAITSVPQAASPPTASERPSKPSP